MRLGLEQAVFYNFGTDSDGVGGRSAAGLDFLLGRGSMIPYIGGNIGYIYGSGIKDDAFAGPEIGLAIGPLNAKVAYDMPTSAAAPTRVSSRRRSGSASGCERPQRRMRTGSDRAVFAMS